VYFFGLCGLIVNYGNHRRSLAVGVLYRWHAEALSRERHLKTPDIRPKIAVLNILISAQLAVRIAELAIHAIVNQARMDGKQC
jgi:hypothetical protein